MPIVADAAIAVRGDLGPFNRDLKNADGTVKGFGARLKSALSPGNLAAGLAGGFAVTKVVDFLGDATQAAGVFQDTVAATGVIFDDEFTPALEAWAEGAATAFGASKQLALDSANTVATLGKAAGLAGQELVDFSTEVVQLGGDLASFRGGTTEDAITAIGAALRGEMEPIRRYGVTLDDATLRQKAFEMGLISTTKNALTPQQRVLAAHAAIMASTTDAQGDFARTSGGLMNQQRIAAAKLDNAMIDLGNSLVPLMTAFAGFAAEVLPAVVEQIKGLIDLLIPMAGLLAEHADIIIPALVAVLGIHLVKSLKGVTLHAKLTGVAMKGMLGPIGLLLIAAEGLEAAGNLVGDFMLEATRGKEAATSIRAIAEEMADLGPLGKAAAERIHDAGISLEEFQKLVEAAGGDGRVALKALADASFDLNAAMLELSGGATTMSQEWAAAWDEASATVTTEGGFIVSATEKIVADVTGEVEEGAEVIVGKFGEIPGDGADAMLDEQWRLKDATQQLLEFMDRALSPMEEIAMLRGFLTGKALARALTSNNPLIRAKAIEMRDAALARLDELGPAGERAGRNLSAGVATGIDRFSYLAYQAAARLSSGVAGFLPVNSPPENRASPLANIYGVGHNIVDAIASGILRDLNSARQASASLAGALNPNLGIPAMAGGGGASPVSVAAGVGAGNTYNVTTASRPKEKTTLEIAHELRRAEYLNVLPGLNTNDQ